MANIIGIKLNNIYRIYCISYVKIYLKYYVNALFKKEKYKLFRDREEVNKILFSINVQRKHVVTFYVLKLLLKKFGDWDKFVNYYNSICDEKNDVYGFNKTKNILEIGQNEYFIKPPFLLHLNKIRENDEYNKLLSNIENGELNKNLLENIFLKAKKYNYLYIFLTNISLYFHSYKNIEEVFKKKDNFTKIISDTLLYLNDQKNSIDQDILLFINTFFDKKNLTDKIFPKIGLNKEDMDEKILHKINILYYSLLFIFYIIISQNNKNKSTNKEFSYQNLIFKNITSIIDSNYIPGIFQVMSLRIKSFYQIKDVLKKEPLKYGAYICSCGYHYTIDKCTFPTREFNCPICKKKIGGLKFNLVKREGHMRIFLNDETRKQKLTKKYRDKYIPNMLLDDFEKEINEQKRNIEKGIKTNDYSKEDFLLEEENVRDMNDITYRFLNFLLYSFIFYGNVMGYIKDKKYNIENMTYFNILEKNWEIMQKILDKIPVELFINLIFDDIISQMISCNKFNSKEDAFKFEKEINEIIINKIKEKDLINKFKQINDNCMNLDYLSNKSIIEELFPYDKYPEKDFPDFKYFYISELPSQEHFIQKFNSKDRNKEYYPIINSIINNGAIYSKIELMKYLPKINKLCNYMLNFVSFKYSRDDAKRLKIKDVIKDEEILSLLKQFISIYKKIRPYIKQEGCHEFGDLYLEMNEDSVLLSDLCVDSGEMGFGLVLLATYKEMSGWQNNFINSIINSENIQLKNYKDLFNSKIMIQDCENDQILDLPHFDTKIILRNGTNSTLFDMILDNSYRKESEVIYNYEEIEEELAAFILPKIKAFKQDFRKVIYQYECFVGERSSLIIDFNDKYQIRELTEIELNSIVCYILKKIIN